MQISILWVATKIDTWWSVKVSLAKKFHKGIYSTLQKNPQKLKEFNLTPCGKSEVMKTLGMLISSDGLSLLGSDNECNLK